MVCAIYLRACVYFHYKLWFVMNYSGWQCDLCNIISCKPPYQWRCILWNNLRGNGKVRLFSYVNQALWWMSMAENQNCPTTFLRGLAYMISSNSQVCEDQLYCPINGALVWINIAESRDSQIVFNKNLQYRILMEPRQWFRHWYEVRGGQKLLPHQAVFSYSVLTPKNV